MTTAEAGEDEELSFNVVVVVDVVVVVVVPEGKVDIRIN